MKLITKKDGDLYIEVINFSALKTFLKAYGCFKFNGFKFFLSENTMDINITKAMKLKKVNTKDFALTGDFWVPIINISFSVNSLLKLWDFINVTQCLEDRSIYKEIPIKEQEIESFKEALVEFEKKLCCFFDSASKEEIFLEKVITPISVGFECTPPRYR